MRKKIFYIIILIVFIALIVVGAVWATKNSEAEEKAKTTAKISSDSNEDDTIVIGDNYFITQINDIYMNFSEYEGKTIEIEGFPLNDGYTFVARYGPGCCAGDGIGLLEYQYDEELDLEDEEDWIKVIGVLKEGFDGETEYIYIDATSVEKMSERGIDTVNN